mgnify:CR=1 FL=1|tara:strand:+ start:935 stop:1360 length:426 start_codon:yes stop_codon:yes gene_type:complete
MSKLFKNFEEYLSTVITIIKDYPDKSYNRIRLAINVCDSLQDDREKIHRLNTTLMECFWEIPDAINIGFPQYLKKEYTKTRELLDYHKVNCNLFKKEPFKKNCVICETRQITIEKLRGNNERTRPKIHSQQEKKQTSSNPL